MSKSIKQERTEWQEGYSKPARHTIAKAINVRRQARKAKRKSWEQQDKGE